ncbi:Protein of unknown function DUF4153 [Paracoccaceae bacterium]
MQGKTAARAALALTGALGGLCLWAAFEASDRDWIGDYASLILSGGVLTLFGALLAMAGPLGLWRALPRALGLAGVAGALLWLTKLRYADTDGFFTSPIPALAGFVVATLPVPFLIAAARTGWRDYPALFLEAWSIILRFAAALTFTGVVWLVIFLSNEVLGIVGITLIERLLEDELAPMVLTGAILGLGLAVIHDLAEYLSPYLVLRLFRLFLPLVLGVMVVFLVALPFRGLDGLTGGLSPALLLLTMVAAGVALVSIAVDQTDAEATQSVVQIRSAQGLALILPVIAGLALWAIWLRTGQHGWTPERVFVALIGGVGLGYGLVYAAATLRGGGWMERIRQGNIRMVLVVIGLAGLWLTPVMNAEKIAATNQLARFADGRATAETLDIYTLGRWGKPGDQAMAKLALMAKDPGQEALARLLAGETTAPLTDQTALATALAKLMPVQPPSATGTRDTLLAGADGYLLESWTAICTATPDTGAPACLMVVADLMPLRPGEEAMLFLQHSPDYIEIIGVFLDDGGVAQTRSALRVDGGYISPDQALALMQQYQTTPAPVTAVLLNQMGTGDAGLFVLP